MTEDTLLQWPLPISMTTTQLLLMLPNSIKLYQRAHCHKCNCHDHRVLAMAMNAVQSVACARLVDVVWLLTLHAMAVQGLLGRKKRTYADLVAECNKAGMADSLCRAMVASEMVQQQGSQKLLAELKAAMASKAQVRVSSCAYLSCFRMLCLVQ